MRFQIRHQTTYQYSSPIQLSPQLLRFNPREDGAQHTIDHQMRIVPEPAGSNDHISLEGNRVTQIWFEEKTDHFQIDVDMTVDTLRKNAFDFILDPGTTTLPIMHTHDMNCSQSYLERINADDLVTAYAAELSLSVEQDTLSFLEQLTRKLHADFNQVIRDHGEPQTPSYTLQSKSGACRDLSVLFVDCCRAEGIPARFVSGYQKGHDQMERRYLHAWPEVYMPGAGWRAYDPTHGEAIADTHVTIAAAAHPKDTMPVIGSFIGESVSSTMDFNVEIDVSES
jgi:transglutaminase-like putative cysteine protease